MATASCGCGSRVDGNLLVCLVLRCDNLIGRSYVRPRVSHRGAVFAALVVCRHGALQWRGRPDLVADVAAAFLAGLCEIRGLVRPVDLLVGVGNDRNFERYRVCERVGQLGVECHPDNQDAVHQGGQKQHGRQSIGCGRRHHAQLVERIYGDVNVRHMRGNIPPFCSHKSRDRVTASFRSRRTSGRLYSDRTVCRVREYRSDS